MPSTPEPAPGARRRLRSALAMLIVATSALIVLGALVRAHDAGLACPDWPRCFGTWIPEMDFQVAFEWSHRAVAGSVALVYAALGMWIWRRPDAASARPWVVLGAVLLAVQIVLGGLTVLLQLASWTVTAHLLTGNSFNATLLAIALALREPSGAPAPPLAPGARIALAAFAALLVVQIGLGGAVSSQYAGLACPEWPTCNGGAWFPSLRGSVGLHLAHRVGGYSLVVVAAALGATARAWEPGRGRYALPLLLVVVQAAVGIANVVTGIPVEVTALHSAIAALLVLATTWLCYTQARDATL